MPSPTPLTAGQQKEPRVEVKKYRKNRCTFSAVVQLAKLAVALGKLVAGMFIPTFEPVLCAQSQCHAFPCTNLWTDFKAARGLG